MQKPLTDSAVVFWKHLTALKMPEGHNGDEDISEFISVMINVMCCVLEESTDICGDCLYVKLANTVADYGESLESGCKGNHDV